MPTEECPNCRIVHRPGKYGGNFQQVIQHCEAYTKAHEVLAERDTLQVLLNQSKKLYEITLANELRWMRKHEEVEKERDALRERLRWLADQLSPSMYADHGQANLAAVAWAMREGSIYKQLESFENFIDKRLAKEQK